MKVKFGEIFVVQEEGQKEVETAFLTLQRSL
jgi:hypothetical protein